jgi:hypothetical protein
MKLNNLNYYSQDANIAYISVSQYKDFFGWLGKGGCEARGLARLKGEWIEEPSTAMLVGSFVDAFWEGTLAEFKEAHPEMYLKNGELKKDYQKAAEICKLTYNDDFFRKYMGGEKQVIMTAELFGAKWKIKMDSYHAEKVIVDLKVVKDIHERFWVKDYGYFINFIMNWGYDFQGAIYQLVVEQNTGKKLPFFVAAADKTKTPDKAIIPIPHFFLDDALTGVERNVERLLELKNGNAEPIRCEKCDYCKATKQLKGFTDFDKLIEV